MLNIQNKNSSYFVEVTKKVLLRYIIRGFYENSKTQCKIIKFVSIVWW